MRRIMALFIINGLILTGCRNIGQQASVAGVSSDDYIVACYYFPNWGPVDDSEWQVLQDARPKFEGHQQPKVPLWGVQNERDPKVMAQKIDAAADHGIDCFIFDWYWYDNCGLRLGQALEEGFLKADNNNRIKFSIMWANHDAGAETTGWYGAVKPETFDKITDYLIRNYFSHPSYLKINGCPYFSVYEFFNLVKTFGSVPDTIEALERFRQKTKAAGFPDLHLNVVSWGVRPADLLEKNPGLRVDSLTSYVWVHHLRLPDFPANDYQAIANKYFKILYEGGGANGLEKPMIRSKIPYYPNVTMGWDPSPRCNPTEPWVKGKPYPFGPVMVNNTPEAFKKELLRAREFVDQCSYQPKMITLYAWNEWSEGGYLEPDSVNKMGYLNAIQAVFSDVH